MRYILLSFALLGCDSQVACPAPEPENGYCEVHDDCAESDFCWDEWCDGTADGLVCRPVERCWPRLQENDSCTEERQCQPGQWCVLTDHPTSGHCKWQ